MRARKLRVPISRSASLDWFPPLRGAPEELTLEAGEIKDRVDFSVG